MCALYVQIEPTFHIVVSKANRLKESIDPRAVTRNRSPHMTKVHINIINSEYI